MIAARYHRVTALRLAKQVIAQYRLDGGPGSGPHAGYKRGSSKSGPVSSGNVKSSPAPASYGKISSKTLNSKRVEYQNKVNGAKPGTPEHKKASIKLGRIEGELAHRGVAIGSKHQEGHAAAPRQEHAVLAASAVSKQAEAQAAIASGDYKTAIAKTKEAAGLFKKATAEVKTGDIGFSAEAHAKKHGFTPAHVKAQIAKAESFQSKNQIDAATSALEAVRLPAHHIIANASKDKGSFTQAEYAAASGAKSSPVQSANLSKTKKLEAIGEKQKQLRALRDVEKARGNHDAAEIATNKITALEEMDSALRHAEVKNGLKPVSTKPPKNTDEFTASVHAALDVIPPHQQILGDSGAEHGPIVDSYGGSKVFVHAVREKLGMDKQTFASWALRAQQEGKIALARFDLIGAANRPTAHRVLDETISGTPSAPKMGNTDSTGATFNFIVRPGH